MFPNRALAFRPSAYHDHPTNRSRASKPFSRTEAALRGYWCRQYTPTAIVINASTTLPKTTRRCSLFANMARETRQNRAQASPTRPLSPSSSSPVPSFTLQHHDTDERGGYRAQRVDQPHQQARIAGHSHSPVTAPSDTHHRTLDKDRIYADDLAWADTLPIPDFLAKFSPAFGDRHYWDARIRDRGYKTLRDVPLLKTFYPDLIELMLDTYSLQVRWTTPEEMVAFVSDSCKMSPAVARRILVCHLWDKDLAAENGNEEMLEALREEISYVHEAVDVLAAEMVAWKGVYDDELETADWMPNGDDHPEHEKANAAWDPEEGGQVLSDREVTPSASTRVANDTVFTNDSAQDIPER